MKKILILIMTVILLIVAIGCITETINEKEETKDTTESKISVDSDTEYDFGAKSALEKENFSIEEMLRYAIEDEYFARQEYESILEKFGEQKPFSNIIKAEERHIELLKDIYTKYEYTIPEDTAIDHVVLPEDIKEALEIGVQAEIDNIAMYEKFLEQVLPDDIRDVFIELRDGSKKHLNAFKKGPRGNGNG